MSLGALRASPLGESAPQLGSRPNDTPQWRGVGDGLFLSFARELILCAMRRISILPSHFHGSALHMMDIVEMSMQISFDMYKLRLQTWWPAKPLDTSHDRWRFPVGHSLVPFFGAHRRRRTVKYHRVEC